MTKTRQWTVFTAVAVIVVFAAGWLLLMKPQRSHASDLRSQAATQQQANQVLLSQIAQLQQEEKALPQQQAALRKFTTQVPDNAAEPTLIRQLSAVAKASNIDLLSMTPGTAALLTATAAPGSTALEATPTTAGQVYELPIALNVTGTYPNLESFFLSLEKLPRATLVGSWSICSGNSSGGSSGGGSGGSCAAPSSPTGADLATNVLGGTLNANVFYAPPVGATATTPAAGSTSTTTTTPTTAPSATTAPTSTPAS